MLLQIILASVAGAANNIMPLGDSITQGITSGVPDEAFQVSYRKALYDKLEAAGYVVNDEIFVGTLFSGESVPNFDPDHDGHSGWQADEIVNGRSGFPPNEKLDQWLDAAKPNIVLLHIGTNDISNNNEDWTEVDDILDVIDNYENTPSGNAVWVILSLIIERGCDPYTPPCPNSDETTTFNDNVRNEVFIPRQASGDKIVLVDMQNGAGIDYRRSTIGGDMWDDIHPFADFGFAKMANAWFASLQQILPLADAGPDQSVDEFETVTLDGSGSTDPKIGNGDNLSYKWVQTAGTPVLLSDDTAVQPTFDAPGAGALTFMLTVTDEDELVSTDTVKINVTPFAEIIGTWSSGIWYWDVFTSRWTQMTTSTTTGDIAAGDFTGDGKADVASIWPSGLWYQDGATLAWTQVPGDAPDKVTAGDVTGDGRSEIIGTWSNGIWYRDVAASSWTKMTSSVTDGDIAAGDFTGDGRADVASSWGNGLWYQDGATLVWTKVSSSAADRLTAGDVTGDGRSEIIGTWSNGIWYWDVAESRWTKMTSSVTDGDIAAGDFTGDGRADVASSWGNGLWYQDGVSLVWTKVSSTAADRLTAGDVTGD
jgi:hypothetical protein